MVTYVKVSANPVNSIAKQGFGIDMVNKKLSRNNTYYRMPRSVERAIKAKERGDYVEPFRFILEEISSYSHPIKISAKMPKKALKKIAALDKFVTSTHNKPAPKVTWDIFEPPISPPQAKYVLTDEVVSFFYKNQSWAASKANPLFEKIVSLLKENKPEEASKLVNIAFAIDKESDGVIKNDKGVLKYNNEEINESVTDWLLKNMSRGQGAIQPVVNFLTHLKKNPSQVSVDSLWRFIKKNGLIITSTGHLIAYKYTRDDMYDKFTGKHYNGLGCTLKMPREDVCADVERTCAPGYHNASYSYVNPSSTIIEVLLSPEHVVSCPRNEEDKLRVCSYTVYKILRHKGQEINKMTTQEEFFSI